MKKQNHDENDEVVDLAEAEENWAEVIKKLRWQLKTCEREKADYLAGWQRAKADYINLKNSSEKEKLETVNYAKETLLHELINLADSFELAFANKEAWQAAPENWRQGVEYIYSNLIGILDDNEVTEINPLHQPFDHHLHHCLGTVEVDDPEQEEKVVEVLKKGYSLKDKVIRPAHVKVGKLVKSL